MVERMNDHLTRDQVYKSLCENRYLAVRYSDYVIGVNCLYVKKWVEKKGLSMGDTLTNVTGFYPISFHEYIRIKNRY